MYKDRTYQDPFVRNQRSNGAGRDGERIADSAYLHMLKNGPLAAPP